jgi:hypothetical protein
MTKEERITVYKKFMPSGIWAEDFFIKQLDSIGFFTAPASRSFHGSYEGGLFDHSFAVAKYLTELTEKLGLKWQREDSPYIVGMFHDLCKCGQYKPVGEKRTNWEHVGALIIPGHGERSVIMAQKWLYLNDEEIACIRWHMGAYETDTRLWQCYNLAMNLYPNVLWTHTADNYVSQVLEV